MSRNFGGEVLCRLLALPAWLAALQRTQGRLQADVPGGPLAAIEVTRRMRSKLSLPADRDLPSHPYGRIL
jgi:hypothetical protein